MLKNNKGITLVALVITIIVLLILAVVAIGAVRDSGIIGHAQNSADKYNTGKAEEETMLGQYESEISKYETKDNGNEDIGIKQIKEGDLWQNVTVASNISNSGIILPSSVKAYNGSESKEVPINEVEFKFYVEKDNNYWRIEYTPFSNLPTGEEAPFLYIEQHVGEEIIGVYFKVFDSVGSYNEDKLYTYNMNSGAIEEYKEILQIEGIVNKAESELNYGYKYSCPILEGLEACFNGTVEYAK